MMNASKYLIAVVLILFFSGKVAVSVSEKIKKEEKVITEKQEEKSDEKSGDTNAEAVESSIQHSPLIFFTIKSSYFGMAYTFPEVEYFAIPTPPPWC